MNRTKTHSRGATWCRRVATTTFAFLVVAGTAHATTVTVSVDPTGTVTRDGVPMVTGTVVCSTPTTLHLSGSINQFTQHRRHFEFADFEKEVACSPTPSAWTTAPLLDQSGPFRRGAVELSISTTFADGTYGGFLNATSRLR